MAPSAEPLPVLQLIRSTTQPERCNVIRVASLCKAALLARPASADGISC